MNVPGISSNEIANGAQSASGGVAQKNLDKSSFVTLLVSQLKNQDPLAPTDNQAFIAQLAQFSSLEEMQNLNQNILGLAVLQQSNALMAQLTQSSALIGKNVRYVDPATNEEREGLVSSVKIVDGLAVLNIGGEDVPLGNVSEITGDPAPEDGAGAGDDQQD
jgi:flagellar basal-body rod modification protein FlgD